VSSIYIAEIAGRHTERNRAGRSPERHSSGEIVHGLSGDPCPVDRIDRRQIERAPQLCVGEQGFDEILTVVKSALDGDCMSIRRIDRRHLPALNLGNSIVRKEHKYVDCFPVAASLERGGAGVS
jgi:hypothetical protein